MILKLLLNTRTIWMMFIKKIEEYNPKKTQKTRKILIVFNDKVADMLIIKSLIQ